MEYFERYITLAVEVVNSAFKSKLNIETIDNVEIDQYVISVGSEFFDYDDIIFLNQEFDLQLHNLVNNGIVSKKQYFDHLTKLSLFFASVESNNVVAA